MVPVPAPLSLDLPKQPWANVIGARMRSAHNIGSWTTDALDAPSCVAHALLSDSGSLRVQVGAWGTSSAAVALCVAAACTALDVSGTNVTIAALDRKLVEPLEAALDAKLQWRERCGLYMLGSSALPTARDPPTGAVLRALRRSDAETLDARWAYRSATSVDTIVKMIGGHEPRLGCIGCVMDGELVGWIARYADGALGMLYVEECARRRGVGALLVSAAARDLQLQDEPCFCYIVDGNDASRGLFEAQGWERVADADWVGFSRATSTPL